MTTNGRAPTTTTVEGVVDAVNERGIRVAGEWLNVSQFRRVQVPDVGTAVRVQVDAKGFIRDIDVLDSKVSEPHKTAGVERDERITKLAVLKAAADFLGQLSQTREEVRSEHVLVLADKWLAWVEKNDDA